MVRVVALGAAHADDVPASALAVLNDLPAPHSPPLPAAVAALLPRAPVPLGDLAALPPDAVVVALDADAHRIARALPGAQTTPAREALRSRAIGAEVAALAAVGLRLRRECPWDRVQTPETIVPHTIEEAFEVAEAVASGRGLADELGDLLFQAVFLAQLLEEEPDGADLAAVARGQADKLVARHPHVYARASVPADAEGVVDMWERRKRAERRDEGIFHELPPGLPALAFATKVQRRAAAVGFDHPSVAAALAALEEEVAELAADTVAHEVGDVLFATTAVSRAVGVDPEIALRASAQRFRVRLERAAALADAAGDDFAALDGDAQIAWYVCSLAEEALR